MTVRVPADNPWGKKTRWNITRDFTPYQWYLNATVTGSICGWSEPSWAPKLQAGSSRCSTEVHPGMASQSDHRWFRASHLSVWDSSCQVAPRRGCQRCHPLEELGNSIANGAPTHLVGAFPSHGKLNLRVRLVYWLHLTVGDKWCCKLLAYHLYKCWCQNLLTRQNHNDQDTVWV